MAAALLVLGFFAMSAAPSQALASQASVRMETNPVRKVVSLLQALQAKVEQEGEQEAELYQKFECYCSKGSGDLSASIGDAQRKIPELESSIAASEEQKTQLQADVKQAQSDRVAAKTAIEEATAVREKEAAAFAAYKATADSNIVAITKAVAALEKGSGAFLQTGSAQALKSFVQNKQEMNDGDREELLTFLEGSSASGYAPQAGEVAGILKQIGGEAAASLAEATAAEEAAAQSYDGLVAAKEKEVEALSGAIETKIVRVGELGVAVVQLKNDLEETRGSLGADQEFLENLQSSCATKKAEFEERLKTRADELAALADTIKLLNDDDALDLFKATLPGSSQSFLQLTASASDMRQRALAVVRGALRSRGRSGLMLERILVALHGKSVGFEKVLELIDGMVELLKKEQVDDDSKKEFCSVQFDNADDKMKALERSVADSETAITKTEEGITRLADETAALDASLKELDKVVAQATEQRQRENGEYQQLIASNNAAKQLLNVAKNRLNKFYNPKLYKEPAKKELSAEDRVVASMSFVQVSAHVQDEERSAAAPPPAPETFDGKYAAKTEESTGVIAMIDLLEKDLDKEIAEAEAEENNAQADYDTLMKDSSVKRTEDAKSLAQKEGAKADLQGDLESHKSSKASTTKELLATAEYIAGLHSECDWLLQNFDPRKEARGNEIDSLKKAKAVLSGASYSLLQTGVRRAFLARPSA